MAIAFQAASSTMAPSSAGEVTVTNTLSRTAATNFIVAYGGGRFGGATAITYDSVAMTQAVLENSSDSTSAAGPFVGIGMYYMFSSDLPVSTGTYTLSATFPTTGEHMAVVAGIALSGVEQTTAGHVIAQVSQTATSSTTLSVSITSNEADSWIIIGTYARNSTVDVGLVVGAEQTVRVDLRDIA